MLLLSKELPVLSHRLKRNRL